MKTAALIVAAGRGTRAGSGDAPKQYRHLQGKAVLRHSLDLFLGHPAIDNVLVVIARTDGRFYNDAAPQHSRLLPSILGGETRQQSVRNGLSALARARPDLVLIHDAARPFLSADLVSRVIEALSDMETPIPVEAVVPVLAVTNTLKALDETGTVSRTVPRDGLFEAETPQGFAFASILAAHEEAAASGIDFTDDAAIAEWAGIPVRTVAGEIANIKLTTAEDIVDADRRLASDTALSRGDLRVGTGYDVHAFGPGNSVLLGGVAIPHTNGLVGHSDADVALHALTDAILGALAEEDIGTHFPPSDAQWRGVSSDRFLAFAVQRVAARGGSIAHLDLVILAEAPKVAPHRDAIRQRIAAICGIGLDRVGVKATTTEKLGFIGRGEGIAAMATATVRLPFGGAS